MRPLQLTGAEGRLLAERFEAGAPVVEALGRFNVCPTEPVATVAAEAGKRAVRTVRWGLVPPWARRLGEGYEPINARAETAAAKRPFAELFARPQRRCLVLADGWYEWLRPEHPKGERIPFRYTVDGGELVCLALILACEPNAVCAPVHDRMPCVLTGPEEEAAWLAGDSDGLLGPLAAERTGAAPANPQVNRAGVEGSHLIEAPINHVGVGSAQLKLDA